jgi:hypothetical protein
MPAAAWPATAPRIAPPAAVPASSPPPTAANGKSARTSPVAGPAPPPTLVGVSCFLTILVLAPAALHDRRVVAVDQIRLRVEVQRRASDAVHARRLRRRREIGAGRARADLQPIAALATRTDKRAAGPKRERGCGRA